MNSSTIDLVRERIRTLTAPARCLYVEDNDYDYGQLVNELSTYQVHMDRAVDVYTAMNSLAKYPFDIVILDLSLKCPGNGIGVLRHLIGRQEHPPIIVLTGADTQASIYREAMQIGNGRIGIFQKPLDAQQVGLLFGSLK